MLKLNSELRAASRTTLSGNWTIAALVTLLYLLIAGGVSSILFLRWELLFHL